LVGSSNLSPGTSNFNDLFTFSLVPYVAYVARFSLTISMGANECRRLHATWTRHTSKIFCVRARDRLQAKLPLLRHSA
jgi:hypothetical protein